MKLLTKIAGVGVGVSLVAGSFALGQSATETKTQPSSTQTTSGTGAPTPHFKEVGPTPTIGEYTPTPEEASAWLMMTDTSEERQQVVADLEAAFGEIADVGTGAEEKPTPLANSSGIIDMEPVLAYGINSTHVWIIASYADVARAAITVAVRYCKTRLPGWLCDSAGRLLSNLASGYAPLSNHGVWAAAYWAPPRVTGGRY